MIGQRIARPSGTRTDEEERSADDLQGEDDLQVAAHEKGCGKLDGERISRRRHVNEMKEAVKAENDKDQTKQDARDDGDDFHGVESLRRSGRKDKGKALSRRSVTAVGRRPVAFPTRSAKLFRWLWI